MKKLAKKELAIGISVIAAILILIFGIEFLKGINLFRPAHFYIAQYENVSGLEVSAPVLINGYKVGQVREINFDYEKPGLTTVVLALNKHLQLPEDSYASLGSSIMGEGFVELHLGESSKMLPVGSVVRTSKAGGLMTQISEQLMPQISVALTGVDSLLNNLNYILSDPALKNTVTRLDGISYNVMLASDGLNTIMNKDVPGIMRNTNGIIGNMNGIVYNIDTISNNLARLTGELNNLPISQTMESVNQTVNNLEAFSSQLKNQNSTLGKIMNDPELYNRLNNVAASVDSLIIDIKKNPKRYISIKLL